MTMGCNTTMSTFSSSADTLTYPSFVTPSTFRIISVPQNLTRSVPTSSLVPVSDSISTSSTFSTSSSARRKLSFQAHTITKFLPFSTISPLPSSTSKLLPTNSSTKTNSTKHSTFLSTRTVIRSLSTTSPFDLTSTASSLSLARQDRPSLTQSSVRFFPALISTPSNSSPCSTAANESVTKAPISTHSTSFQLPYFQVPQHPPPVDPTIPSTLATKNGVSGTSITPSFAARPTELVFNAKPSEQLERHSKFSIATPKNIVIGIAVAFTVGALIVVYYFAFWGKKDKVSKAPTKNEV